MLFVNGPVQNGDFTFADRPGKAAGIRLAAALDQLLANQPVPHLWNTVTLAGDLRHRQHTADAATPMARAAFEASLITAKYNDGHVPAAAVMTDADPAVAQLALEVTEAGLRAGELSISSEQVRTCTGCGHMTGTGAHPCRVCGGTSMHTRALPVLVADRDPDRPALDFDDVHAHRKRAPLHLRNIASNVPTRLILARTRAHGISLKPLGLPGLVLDPRAGLHAAALSAARAQGADTAVMVLTPNAAANVAAYGQPYLRHDGTRLLYGLHGHIPYDALPDLADAYQRYRFTPAVRAMFEMWFLPLPCSARSRLPAADGVRPHRFTSPPPYARRSTPPATSTRAPHVQQRTCGLALLGHDACRIADRRSSDTQPKLPPARVTVKGCRNRQR